MAIAGSARIILKPSGYQLIHPLFKSMDPERAHRQTIALLKTISTKRALHTAVSNLYGKRVPQLPIQLFGKSIANPIGLAAGFDKDGTAYPALAALGFGLIEIGTVTPDPQPGNPGVRIFRLNKEQSIINRLGFNSAGLKVMLRNLSIHPALANNTLLGINIGKNTSTPNERAYQDYATCLEAIYGYADYVVLNLSSPNSPGLRLLQQKAEFSELLERLLLKRVELSSRYAGQLLPIAVKISPDLSEDDLVLVAETAVEHQLDALIATNTTTSRELPIKHRHYTEQGGLSGRLLAERSTSVIKLLSAATGGGMPIIGVGGVSSAQDAWQKLLAGASAVQLYSALTFQGPDLVRHMVNGLAKLAARYDQTNFTRAIELARQQR